MSVWQITNTTSGADLGMYAGDTEIDALDAMSRMAGYASYAAAQEVTGDQRAELRLRQIDLGFGALRSEDENIAYAAQVEIAANATKNVAIETRGNLTAEEIAAVETRTARNYYLQGCVYPTPPEEVDGLDTFPALLPRIGGA